MLFSFTSRSRKILGFVAGLGDQIPSFQIGFGYRVSQSFELFHPFQEFHFLDLLHLMRLLYKK